MPSELLHIEDELTAWMFDTAITWFGITIENALNERVKVGTGKWEKHVPKYTLARLLSEDFLLNAPQPEAQYTGNPFAVLASWIGRSRGLIRRWEYRPPVKEEKEEPDGGQ
jgi:hypothetical protein